MTLLSPKIKLIHLCGPKPSSSAVSTNIVLVHGIDGHFQQTWSGKKGREPWYERLCKEKATVSVLSVKTPYTHKRRWKSRESYIEELSMQLIDQLLNESILDRPTIFVCHSLGGLLVKRVLSDALNHSRNRDLDRRRSNWRSIFFLGVPHNGSPWANTWLAWGLLGLRSETSRDLKPDRRFLKDIDNRFRGTFSKYAVCSLNSFHETLPVMQENGLWLVGTRIAKTSASVGPIVPRVSSELAMPDENNRDIHACHSTIAQLDQPASRPILDKLLKQIQAIERNPSNKIGLLLK